MTTETIDVSTGEVTNAPQLPAEVPPKRETLPEPAPPAAPVPHDPQSVGDIAKAYSAIVNEIGVIPKKGHNKFHNYNFVRISDVLQRLAPLMAQYGLIVTQGELERSMLDGGNAVAIQYQFFIGHTSGSVWPDRPKKTGLSRCRDSKGGFDDKSFNKASTAARKYFLMEFFQIPTEELDEYDADEDRDLSRGRKPKAPAPNVIREPSPGSEEATAPAAADGASSPSIEPLPTTEGDEASLSIEDRARKAAKKGKSAFGAFYRSLGEQDRPKINAIGDQLRELIDAAEAKKKK